MPRKPNHTCIPWIMILCILFCSYKVSSQSLVTAGRMNEVFLKTDLVTLLSDPWEITYGPDDSLWVTESKGYRVSKVNPNNGGKRIILDLTTIGNNAYKRQFGRSQSPWPQGGLMGLAIHPQFKDSPNKKFVYLAFVYSYTGQQPDSMGAIFVNKLVRFTYDPVTNMLVTPTTICDTLPGSSDHNSGRMIIAPVNGVNYLFYAQGDMGAGQFANKYRTNKAQNSSSYEGKILRFNLEQDTDQTSALDKWIPNDNPYNLSHTSQSAVWAMGIRNNQGFAYAKIKGKEKLYGASHGPYSDDEINIIDSMKNYGHPYVIGYKSDNNYANARAGAPPRTSPALSPGASTLPLITSEIFNADTLIGPRYRDPIFAAYGNQTSHFIDSLYLNNPGNGSWPSEAWSGMDIDTSNVIPGFKNSLLLGSLKWGRVVRLKLDGTGDSIDHSNNDTVSYFGSKNRFRDLALDSSGKTFYVLTDSSTTTSGPSAGNPLVPDCYGCVQKYTFLGYHTFNNRSAISPVIDIAPGTPNSCTPGSTVTINSSNKNDTLWVPITGPDGNILAEINAKGNQLGTVTSSFYYNSSGTREDPAHRLYADRNLTITPQTQPGSNVSIRLYLTNAEYTSLKNAINSQGQASGISTITDLRILKNTDACQSFIQANSTTINPSIAEVFGGSGYVLQANISSFSTFYFLPQSMTVLPVNLLSFSGVIQNNSAILKWKTTNEKNMSGYFIERSSDGQNFEKIGMVTATGNNSSESSYSYMDQDINLLSALTVYYRLKLIDADSNYNYSKIIDLFIHPSFSLFVYPIPFKEVLTARISLTMPDNIRIIASDMQGRIVFSQTRFLSSGITEININTKGWPTQTYSIKVVGNINKVTITKKVIKTY